MDDKRILRIFCLDGLADIQVMTAYGIHPSIPLSRRSIIHVSSPVHVVWSYYRCIKDRSTVRNPSLRLPEYSSNASCSHYHSTNPIRNLHILVAHDGIMHCGGHLQRCPQSRELLYLYSCIWRATCGCSPLLAMFEGAHPSGPPPITPSKGVSFVS